MRARVAAVREIEAVLEPGQLESTWQTLPVRLRQARDVVIAQARRAIDLGRPGLAANRLRRLLDQAPDDEALNLYAQADTDEGPGRIADCQRWLQQYPDHAALHRALGVLYLAGRQDLLAREHLEKALAIRPDGETYALLGRVLDRDGQLEAAAQCYRNALRLKSGRSAEPFPPPALEGMRLMDRNSPGD